MTLNRLTQNKGRQLVGPAFYDGSLTATKYTELTLSGIVNEYYEDDLIIISKNYAFSKILNGCTQSYKNDTLAERKF